MGGLPKIPKLVQYDPLCPTFFVLTGKMTTLMTTQRIARIFFGCATCQRRDMKNKMERLKAWPRLITRELPHTKKGNNSML